jgi:hypothetical protein
MVSRVIYVPCTYDNICIRQSERSLTSPAGTAIVAGVEEAGGGR